MHGQLQLAPDLRDMRSGKGETDKKRFGLQD